MYESVVVPYNCLYGKGKSDDPRKVVFKNASLEHITITVVDPKIGVTAEAMIRKDALPNFVTDSTVE
jgi:hypothetical protein